MHCVRRDLNKLPLRLQSGDFTHLPLAIGEVLPDTDELLPLGSVDVQLALQREPSAMGYELTLGRALQTENFADPA